MDTESKIINLSGADYRILKDGRVFRCKSGKEIKQRPNGNGYAVFNAGRKGNRSEVKTHRLVALCFVPNLHSLEEVYHLDSDRMNAAASNFEWVTRQENIRRAYARRNHEGRITGEKNPKARLTEELVRRMREEYRSGSRVKDIADKYGCPWSTVNNAVKGITWKHVK